MTDLIGEIIIAADTSMRENGSIEGIPNAEALHQNPLPQFPYQWASGGLHYICTSKSVATSVQVLHKSMSDLWLSENWFERHSCEW